jgi:hypothetical protein
MEKGGASWFCLGSNNHKASGSGAGGNGGRMIFHAPAPTVVWPLCVPRSERHLYVEVEMARQYAEVGVPLHWPDATSLTGGISNR